MLYTVYILYLMIYVYEIEQHNFSLYGFQIKKIIDFTRGSLCLSWSIPFGSYDESDSISTNYLVPR